jgi:hypothetical protein
MTAIINLSGMFFSTRDRDNDGHPKFHCADGFGGGWWFRNCAHAFLNAVNILAWSPKIRPGTRVDETLMMIKPR